MENEYRDVSWLVMVGNFAGIDVVSGSFGFVMACQTARINRGQSVGRE